VLHAGAGELFQVLVGEVVVECGANVLMGELDAADTFIVCGERDGHMVEAVDGEGMMVAFDAEDAFVGAEVDLDHDVVLSELFHQRGDVVFKHDVDAVTDAGGVAEFDGLADVEAEALGRDLAGSEFAGVKADVDLRVKGVEIADHLHVQGIVAHGDEVVLWLDEVDADESRLVGVNGLLDGFEAEEGLGEDLLGREGAEDLVDVADFDLAGGCGLRGSAVLDLAALGFGVTDVRSVGGNFVEDAVVEEVLAEFGQVRVEADLMGDGCGVAEGRGLHQLEILLVLGSGAACDLVDPLANVGLVEAAEAVERVEELVVSAVARRGDEVAHRQ